MLATVLGGQAIIIFFGALTQRGLTQDPGPVVAGLTPFALMSALAVATLVVAALMKRSFGPALGWGIQILTILSGVWVPLMVLVGLIFAALYGYCHYTGRRIDREQARRDLAAPDQEN